MYTQLSNKTTSYAVSCCLLHIDCSYEWWTMQLTIRLNIFPTICVWEHCNTDLLPSMRHKIDNDHGVSCLNAYILYIYPLGSPIPGLKSMAISEISCRDPGVCLYGQISHNARIAVIRILGQYPVHKSYLFSFFLGVFKHRSLIAVRVVSFAEFICQKNQKFDGILKVSYVALFIKPFFA